MNETNILLIRASHTSKDVRNFRREVPADISVLVPQVVDNYDTESFPIEEFDGYIITGSKSSVLDDEEWISKLSKLVRRIIDIGKPVLGVCWGHQFLASILGGKVKRGEKRELGYRTIHLQNDTKKEYSGYEIDQSGLFMGFPKEFVAFETHGDYVKKIPEGAEILAENEAGVQSFKYNNSFGVQFHPEYDYETALSSYDNYKDNETVPKKPSIDPSLRLRSETASDIFNNFVTQIVQR